MSYLSICEGCEGSGFSWTGYWSHLQQSKDPRCAAVLQRLNLNSEDIADNDGLDLMAQSVLFDGDAFGGAQDYYADENFGQELDDEVVERDGAAAQPGAADDLEEEQATAAAEAATLESGWEPHREGAAIVSGADDAPEEPITEDTDQSSQARKAAEERLECDPFVVQYSSCYPRSQCGVIKEFQHTADQQYSSAFNNASNLWAPFSSEIDWKVARWAKLRGAGSTAFSDLLAINGVRYFCLVKL